MLKKLRAALGFANLYCAVRFSRPGGWCPLVLSSRCRHLAHILDKEIMAVRDANNGPQKRGVLAQAHLKLQLAHLTRLLNAADKMPAIAEDPSMAWAHQILKHGEGVVERGEAQIRGPRNSD